MPIHCSLTVDHALAPSVMSMPPRVRQRRVVCTRCWEEDRISNELSNGQNSAENVVDGCSDVGCCDDEQPFSW